MDGFYHKRFFKKIIRWMKCEHIHENKHLDETSNIWMNYIVQGSINSMDKNYGTILRSCCQLLNIVIFIYEIDFHSCDDFMNVS
jgi:hypothetical protein